MPASLPSPGLIGALVGLPLLLILLNTIINSPLTADMQIAPGIRSVLAMLGHPFIALIIANLAAWYFLGLKRGYSRQAMLDITSKSLAPAGLIILITGAGGVFKQILTETGAGEMLARAMTEYGFSVLVFAFLTAAIIRILQGSATVAMITSAGMTAAFMEGMAFSDMQKALLVISIASGATVLSHVNDSGFWLVSKYFGLTEKQTLRSWTIMETLIGLSGFVVALLLNSLLT